MTNEETLGLKENLKLRYTSAPLSDLSFYESCPGEEYIFSRLAYAISFFHALVSERKKFGLLGWNVPYIFDEIDFLTSVNQLQVTTILPEYLLFK